MMRTIRTFTVALCLVSFAAACGGGSGAATQGTGGGGGGSTQGPTTTEAAEATDAGGGGGGGGVGTQNGKLHLEVSGPLQKSADFGFIPTGSIFGGAQGAALNFGSLAGGEIVSVYIGADQSVVVSYSGKDFSAPGANCTTSNWNIGATSGSGSFECTDIIAITAAGAQVPGVTMKGNFDAHT
jgi:hypothetical protein